MKHLDPIVMADLAEGAAPDAAARRHLGACPPCREELAQLRALCARLSVAPAPGPALRQSTLERLGLRPKRVHRMPRWAWAPALGAAVLSLLWLGKQPDPGSPPAGQAVAPAAPSKQARPPAKRAADPSSSAGALRSAAAAPIEARPPAALGAVEAADPQAKTHVVEHPVAPVKAAEPAPMQVRVHGNLIHPGQALSLEIRLPLGEPLLALVFDGRGRTVATLYQGSVDAEPLNLRWDADGAASGVYTVLLKSGAQAQRIKAIVAR